MRFCEKKKHIRPNRPKRPDSIQKFCSASLAEIPHIVPRTNFCLKNGTNFRQFVDRSNLVCLKMFAQKCLFYYIPLCNYNNANSKIRIFLFMQKQ